MSWLDIIIILVAITSTIYFMRRNGQNKQLALMRNSISKMVSDTVPIAAPPTQLILAVVTAPRTLVAVLVVAATQAHCPKVIAVAVAFLMVLAVRMAVVAVVVEIKS